MPKSRIRLCIDHLSCKLVALVFSPTEQSEDKRTSHFEGAVCSSERALQKLSLAIREVSLYSRHAHFIAPCTSTTDRAVMLTDVCTELGPVAMLQNLLVVSSSGILLFSKMFVKTQSKVMTVDRRRSHLTHLHDRTIFWAAF